MRICLFANVSMHYVIVNNGSVMLGQFPVFRDEPVLSRGIRTMSCSRPLHSASDHAFYLKYKLLDLH